VNAEILTERRGPVLWIRINRPEARNAMKAAMYDRLVAICGEINADDELARGRVDRRRRGGVHRRQRHCGAGEHHDRRRDGRRTSASSIRS